MPKKYKEPSLNKEKLSNKSLVAGRLCPKNSPIIIEDAYIPWTSFETQRDSIDIDIQLCKFYYIWIKIFNLTYTIILLNLVIRNLGLLNYLHTMVV